MLNTLFTLQELCHLWIKKIVCFLCSPPPTSKRNPCSVDLFFVFCWLRWLNLEICGFCTDESWLTLTAKLPSEGSVGAVLLNLISLFINTLSCCCFFKLQNNTNGRFCSFFFPQLDQIFDPHKRILIYFLRLDIYCNFLDLIAFHSGSLEDTACFSLYYYFLHAVPIFGLMAFWTFS